MFDFARPEFLWLSLLVPPLLFWWLWQRRPALRYSDIRFLGSLPRGRGGVARWLGAGLRGGGLLLLIGALAGPRWADAGSRLTTEGIAIEILVDVSGSMAEKDYEWAGKRISRLEAVKRVFHLFVEGGKGPDGERLEGRPDDLIGLIAFATRPRAVCPLTLSHDVVVQILDAEQPRVVPEESRTNIGDAIAWGVEDLSKARPAKKVLVLLTDGEHNVEPPALKPTQAAQLAGNKGIPIFAIDAGGEGAGAEAEGTPRSAEDRARAVQSLQSIAKMTGGKYFRAQDTKALLQVCREIDQMTREEIESFQYRYYTDGFAWFGLGALALLGLVQVLDWTMWRRVL